jgi:hypothetical protein
LPRANEFSRAKITMSVVSDGVTVTDFYEMGVAPLVFRDAIVMPEAEYNLLTPEQIAAIKQERYDNWYAIVTYVPPDPPYPPDPEIIDG